MLRDTESDTVAWRGVIMRVDVYVSVYVCEMWSVAGLGACGVVGLGSALDSGTSCCIGLPSMPAVTFPHGSTSSLEVNT